MSAIPNSLPGGAANDADAQETREWTDALTAVIAVVGGGARKGLGNRGHACLLIL